MNSHSAFFCQDVSLSQQDKASHQVVIVTLKHKSIIACAEVVSGITFKQPQAQIQVALGMTLKQPLAPVQVGLKQFCSEFYLK